MKAQLKIKDNPNRQRLPTLHSVEFTANKYDINPQLYVVHKQLWRRDAQFTSDKKIINKRGLKILYIP